MGIKGLFSFLDLHETSIFQLQNINKIAVDISCWLHKVKYVDNCALAIDKNHTGWKRAFINIFKPLCTKFEVIFVFDGATPEIKRKEHDGRRVNNAAMRKLGLALLTNDLTKAKGMQTLVKLIEVETLLPQVKQLITDTLKAGYVDAEYEADQKLAYMSVNREVDLVLTEDSDLIVYGCPLIMYKYRSGKGMLYTREKTLTQIDRFFENWGLFQRFCVLCGCDYYKHKGTAMQGAFKICRTTQNFNRWLAVQDDTAIKDLTYAVEMFTQFDIQNS